MKSVISNNIHTSINDNVNITEKDTTNIYFLLKI